MGMSRWERKAALPYGAAKQIAERLGVAEPHVSQVLHGKRRDRRVEVAIARMIGKPVDEVFPPKDEVLAGTGGVTV